MEVGNGKTIWSIYAGLRPNRRFRNEKIRPCVVISPNEMNKYLNNIIIAPMTSTIKGYHTRVEVNFKEKKGEIVLDQIKTIDKTRIIKLLGNIDKKEIKEIKRVLKEMLID